jgi:hypothetical protein
MFRRFMLLSALERISPEAVLEDKRRLSDFLKGKKQKSNVVTLSNRAICCPGKDRGVQNG